MTTIRTVAALAGVSPSTVSRAFAQPDIVAPEARQRVLAAAEELGYRPSPVARSLARGRTGNLGLLVPDIANPFFPPLVKAVQQAAHRHDLALFIADSDEQVEEEIGLARAMAKQVDGLVLASPRADDRRLHQVRQLTPVVVVSRDVPGVPAVLTPPDEGLRQAVEHLAALGHRSVVYLAGPAESYADVERRHALDQACRAHRLSLTVLGPFQPRFEAGLRSADLVLAQQATAAVAYNDQIALGLMSRLAERGRVVGRDVSVVGIDDTWIGSVATPALTTVRVPAAAAGTAAVRLLLDGRAGADPDTRVELATELVVRASTGPAA